MERDEQLQRFAEAVERKKAEAKARSEQPPRAQTPGGSPVEGEIERSEVEPGRPQDVYSPREKNTRKGKVTAENWNQ